MSISRRDSKTSSLSPWKAGASPPHKQTHFHCAQQGETAQGERAPPVQYRASQHKALPLPLAKSELSSRESCQPKCKSHAQHWAEQQGLWLSGHWKAGFTVPSAATQLKLTRVWNFTLGACSTRWSSAQKSASCKSAGVVRAASGGPSAPALGTAGHKPALMYKSVHRARSAHAHTVLNRLRSGHHISATLRGKMRLQNNQRARRTFCGPMMVPVQFFIIISSPSSIP